MTTSLHQNLDLFSFQTKREWPSFVKICYDQGYYDIGVVIATKRRHYLFYLQLYFSALGTFLSKSFTGPFSSCFFSNDCYDLCPLSLSKICESVSEIFWNGDFMVRNTIITRQSAWCSAIICRKRSTFSNAISSHGSLNHFSNVCDHGDSFSRLLERWRNW